MACVRSRVNAARRERGYVLVLTPALPSAQATYLATMTKGTNPINDLIDKYNVAFERQSRRRGLF